MKTQLKQKDIFLPEKSGKYSATYEIDIIKYIKSPEAPVENRTQLKVRKSFIKKDENGYLFALETLERTQSNTEDIYDIENSLASLQNNLSLYTNAHGEVISIVNRREIFEKWYDDEAAFKAKHKADLNDIDSLISGIDALINDAEEFLNHIKKTEMVSLLFPPIYNHNLLEEETVSQIKVLSDFFDTTALPFDIKTKVVAINSDTEGYQIARSGDLASGMFDKEKAEKVISTLFKVHKYNINIHANLFEAYDLHEDQSIDEAIQLLNVEIPGVYNYRQVTKLKTV